ncbi:FHA domain-containing protein FhaA [Durusdinium trenchii]|uniref:FHA domain-containing protein FhaA n=1 Tax=Durusdinium trenchii TaxID=1381693 RepID=A0ABP0MNU1_9DINO
MAEPPEHVYGFLRASGVVYQLEEAETTIGRGEECSLVLDGRGVSRNHARLYFDHQGPQLLDLGSSNGTFVNGVRLRPGPLNAVLLQHGDVIRLGLAKWTFSFELPRKTRADAEPPRAGLRPGRASPPRGRAREDAKDGEKVAPESPKEVPKGEPKGEDGKAVRWESMDGKTPHRPQHQNGLMHGSPYANPMNVLPMPFPVMPPMPYPPQMPWGSPPQAERANHEVDSSWKNELLQKLWQLEANISRLADANQEICDAMRSDRAKLPQAEPESFELAEALGALTSAAERLSAHAQLLGAKPELEPVEPLEPLERAKLQEEKVEEPPIAPPRLDRPTPVPARQAPGPAQIVPARPASRGHAPEVGQAVELLKPEELVERLDPLDLDALIMETQRNLSLYALVSGAELSEEKDNSSVSSMPSSSCYKHLMLEGADPTDTAGAVVSALMSELETLERLNAPRRTADASSPQTAGTGGPRRWRALRAELERLRQEEQIEAERLENLEVIEKALVEETEAEFSQIQEASEKGLAAEELSSELLKELARLEQIKDRLAAEFSRCSQQLMDEKALYQEEKSKAEEAMKFHTLAEEAADQAEEDEHSGRAPRMATLERVKRALTQLSETKIQARCCFPPAFAD